MRLKPIIAAMVAMLMLPPAAAADVTARYAVRPGDDDSITVQVNGRGSSRITYRNEMAIVTVEGMAYTVMADLQGLFAVRQDDMIAAMEDRVHAFSSHSPMPSSALPDLTIDPTEAGTEIIAGHTGTIWAFPSPEGTRPGQGDTDYVISMDADLAPIGRALARQFRASRGGLSVSVGPTLMGEVSSTFLPVIQHGTIIRIGQMLRLRSVEIGPISDSVFALPAQVLTREQFVARTGMTTPSH